MSSQVTPDSILGFWFSERVKPLRFAKDTAFDQEITERFLSVYEDAVAGQLNHWMETVKGVLALVIVLDQFPRNMFREMPRSFVADPQAREIANQALDKGLDAELSPEECVFLYMPFMHSEDLADQDRCVALFADLELEENLRYAKLHRDIVAQFGRFPHRNKILGRVSSRAEVEFLQGPNSSF